MTINVLLCDLFPGLLPDDIPTYVSMFEKLFTSIDCEVQLQTYLAWEGDLPDTADPDALYLIPGSRAGAYEDLPWIQKLIAWIQKADALKLHLAGVCFGHQVIAQALGGTVAPSAKGWGAGIRVSQVVDPESASYFPGRTMALFYNHHDQVMNLPPRAVRVATSSFCPNESFRIDNHILTFQGHPEYTAHYARYLIKNHAEQEPQEVKLAALHSIETLQAQGQVAARMMLDMVRNRGFVTLL